MVAAYASAVTGAGARHAHQDPARRRRLGARHDRLVQPRDLAFQGLDGGQQRLERRLQLGTCLQGGADPPRQLARALGKAQPQGPQKAADRVLRIAPLAHQMSARLEQDPRLLRRRALDRNGAAKARARDLRQKLGIARVRRDPAS